MVLSNVNNCVHDVRASSVTRSRVTEPGVVCEFNNMDLAMRLHYIKALYFFKHDAVHGIDIYALKKPMFEWLDLYYPVTGRIRRSENGRPFIKCNDSGVRIFEAKCDKSVDEWLGLKDHELDDQLCQSQVLGPELGFSPLVFLQFTWFTCGGLSVGLSWAHILGDLFSASGFINTWAHITSQTEVPRHPLTLSKIKNGIQNFPKSASTTPFSVKTIDSVGDTWQLPSIQKMGTHSFHITAKVLQKAGKQKIFPFLTALFWKSISEIRKLDTKIVTICNKGTEYIGCKIPDNSQLVGIIKTDFNIEEVDLFDLAKLVDDKIMDERNVIEDYVGKNSGDYDFILYGANLTFVNMEESNLFGLEIIRGKKPVFANLFIAGVGEKGAVLVLPSAVESDRMVTVILPENEIAGLNDVLRKDWGIC